MKQTSDDLAKLRAEKLRQTPDVREIVGELRKIAQFLNDGIERKHICDSMQAAALLADLLRRLDAEE